MSDEHEAVLHVAPGSSVCFETEDCFSHGITRNDQVLDENFDFSCVNPATGPLWIDGAEPGDTLKVSIDAIELDHQGVVELFPGLGVLGHKVSSAATRIVAVKDGVATFGSYALPLNPMIGVIGVAPVAGESVPCGTPGAHGGNLDTVENCAGSVLHLPVFVPGAKLSLGDLHAAMGDGEVCGTGVEIRGVVTVTVDLEKGTGCSNPWIERPEGFYLLASAETLDEAARLVVDDGVAFLMKRCDLSFEEAYMLLSLQCQLRVSQAVNPLKTAKLFVPRRLVDR